MTRRHRTPSRHGDAPPRRTRSTLPWLSVAAGAGVVVLAVSAAGMVGAATGGGRAVEVPSISADGWIDPDSGIAHVQPREPSVEVTRVPPPGLTQPPGEPDPAAPAPDDDQAGGRPAAEPSPEPVTDPTRSPTDESTSEAPTDDPSGTTTDQPADPGTTPAPEETDDPATDGSATVEPDAPEESDAPSAAWVQERLRVHGATLDDTRTFDEPTLAALRAFQGAHGIPGDGKLSEATVAALAADPAEAGLPTAPTTPDPSATTKPSTDPDAAPTEPAE